MVYTAFYKEIEELRETVKQQKEKIATLEASAWKPGVVIDGLITRVLDGDTVEVQPTKLVRVRLRDCWAPESHQDGGPAATSKLLQVTARSGGHCRLKIEGDEMFHKAFSFGRVVGDVVMDGDDETLSEIMVGYRLATATKPKRKKD